MISFLTSLPPSLDAVKLNALPSPDKAEPQLTPPQMDASQAAINAEIPRPELTKGSRFPQLAVELQFAILSYLPRPSLLALSLTHPLLVPVCAPFLWLTLHLSPPTSPSSPPTLRPRLLSLLDTLRANSHYAASVRTLNVELGAGEYADGSEWALVGEVAALLPDVREVDLRSDSVGRWKGIWDPFLRVVLDKGKTWERLERVSVSALVGETGLVRRWLARHGGRVKEIDLNLTQISSAYASQAINATPQQFQYDLSIVGSEEDWSLTPAKLPPPPPDEDAEDQGGLLPRTTSYRGSVATLASIFAFKPNGACPDLATVSLECGHPFGEEARTRLCEDIETTLSGREGAIKRLVLNGGVRPDATMVERLGRAVGEGLRVLEMADPIGFYYRPAPPPLTSAQLTAFPSLERITLRAWGFFHTSLLAFPNSLQPGQERVTLVSFEYDVVSAPAASDAQGDREAVFTGVSLIQEGEYPEWMELGWDWD